MLIGVTVTVNVTVVFKSLNDGIYIGLIAVGSTKLPLPFCTVQSIAPAFWIVAFTFIDPWQTVLSGPALTIGFFTIFITILSVAGVLHGLFPAALKVKVTDPFPISPVPGI